MRSVPCSISIPRPSKRSLKAFVTGGEPARTNFNYVGGDGWLTDVQQHRLPTWLDADGRSTAKAIAWVAEQFGLAYSDSGMRKLLQRLDFRYQQPALFPANADPDVHVA